MQSRQIGFWHTMQFAAPGESGCFAHISILGAGASIVAEIGGAPKGGSAGADPATLIVLTPCAGGATFIGPPLATTDLGALATGSAASGPLAVPHCRAISWFAASVASLAQAGQFTGAGIFPATGSISKANLVPHSQRILIVMGCLD
jgi:hypothetical protein